MRERERDTTLGAAVRRGACVASVIPSLTLTVTLFFLSLYLSLSLTLNRSIDLTIQKSIVFPSTTYYSNHSIFIYLFPLSAHLSPICISSFYLFLCNYINQTLHLFFIFANIINQLPHQWHLQSVIVLFIFLSPIP